MDEVVRLKNGAAAQGRLAEGRQFSKIVPTVSAGDEERVWRLASALLVHSLPGLRHNRSDRMRQLFRTPQALHFRDAGVPSVYETNEGLDCFRADCQ
ncbi:MAG TPA: hypothetical protein VKG64_16360 [Methylomirabilota bacterium]|nr:hypothetical protein [Methylomirabilota bacterium]